MQIEVAPHAGAWIEMRNNCTSRTLIDVAPHAGAWIEIDTITKNTDEKASRSPCGSVD